MLKKGKQKEGREDGRKEKGKEGEGRRNRQGSLKR